MQEEVRPYVRGTEKYIARVVVVGSRGHGRAEYT